ncbi:MAG: hypothetical protein GX649_00390 [Chloroflexi bacterium]|nr:hypothetical protein [Chloroflexota bacterium]
MRVERFPQNPIIRPHMDPRMGDNINGPSLIRVPDWLPNPLGRYYLYFAHHQGQYIRLAYADGLAGPWTTHEPGTLRLEESIFRGHIASPDVHVDDEQRRVRMYYHGVAKPGQILPRGPVPHDPAAQGAAYGQLSGVALSDDGLTFRTLETVVSSSYPRAFRYGEYWYVLSMPGLMFRSRDGLTDFEPGPVLFDPDFRHAAVDLRDHTLLVYYSHVGDCPEHILRAEIDLRGDWMGWQAGEPCTVLEPALEYEGADLPLEPSRRGWAPERVRQLRDPGIYREGEATYLVYSVAGERGLAIARLYE